MQIGTDIALIKRFKDKEELARRILSDAEFDKYINSPCKEEFLAGRFAAKESFIKALGSNSSIPYHLIEVRLEENGRPYIFYKDNKYALSISHDGDYAIAISVI